MARRGHQSVAEDPAVDLTPMLDIVFIMLIFFIVTATFVREEGLDIIRPDQSDSPPDTSNFPILITITQKNEIYIEDRIVSVTAVRANVERLRAENPKATVIIRADERADMETTIGALDQAKAANAANAVIVTFRE